MKKIIFSGTSNLPLAQKIATKSNIKLGEIEITRFIDNECRVWIKEKVTDYDQIYVVQSLSEIADKNLIELCLIGQALRSMQAPHITAIIPFLGYSKQDKAFRTGEAVSAQLVAKLIGTAGFDQVISVELHSENLLPYFSIPLQELSTEELFLQEMKNQKNSIVISPDKGGKGRSEKFAQVLKVPIVYIEKQRNLATGDVTVIKASQDVKNKNILFYDDIINTGETAIKESEYLKSKGVGKITFLATHAVLAGDAAAKLQNSPIDKIIVSDTINIPKEKLVSKIQVISTVDLIINAIKHK